MVVLASFLEGLDPETDEVYDLSLDPVPDDPRDLPNLLQAEGVLLDPDSVYDDHFHDLTLQDDFCDSHSKDLQDFDLHGSSEDEMDFPPELHVPVETFNPLTYPDADFFVTYDFPCRDDPQSLPMMLVVEPQTLPHHMMPHLTSLPPLHLPQPGHSSRSLSLPCLSDSLPPSLSLPNLQHLDLRNHPVLHPSSPIAYSDDDVFLSQEEEEEIEEEGREEGEQEGLPYINCLPIPPPPLPLSRPPSSLDTNWRLGDGEGQFFPSFSQ